MNKTDKFHIFLVTTEGCAGCKLMDRILRRVLDKTINITLPTIPSSLKNPYSLTIQKNGTTITTYDGSTGKTANITVPTKLGELENNLKPLTFGSKTYNGSSEQTITAADVGLGSAYCRSRLRSIQ